MLEELNISNYALIEKLHIEFNDGLTVFTGETGTGKSILAGAMGLVLGVKAETDAIRSGSEESVVSGIFHIANNPDAVDWLNAHEIKPDEGRIVIRRTVKRTGRGSIYIQSVPVTRSLLEELTRLIIDMHGQHEHQSLLSESNHLKLLDQYGKLESDVAELSERFAALTTLKKRYSSMLSKERERLREMDILQFAVQEIEEADLKPEEEEELSGERRILSQHERLFSLLDESYESLAENRGGSLSQLRTTRQSLDAMTTIDSGLSGLAKRVEDLFFELEDVTENLRDYRSTVEFSPQRLEIVEDRLALIHRLEKKYGSTVADVLEYGKEAREQLAGLENWETDKEKLEIEIKKLEKDVFAAARELSEKRESTADVLEKKIADALQSLGMEKSEFRISVKQKESEKGSPICGSKGFDRVAFLISPNRGEPLKPLRTTASGGEISRVMLAIKTVLSQSDRIQTLIFDEIDVGIGGEVAVSVGEHLTNLSEFKQILCITHLASIAARADNHIKVEKNFSGKRTVTEVQNITGRARVSEIARMLAGDKTGEASLSHAEELLRKHGPGEY